MVYELKIISEATHRFFQEINVDFLEGTLPPNMDLTIKNRKPTFLHGDGSGSILDLTVKPLKLGVVSHVCSPMQPYAPTSIRLLLWPWFFNELQHPACHSLGPLAVEVRGHRFGFVTDLSRGRVRCP